MIIEEAGWCAHASPLARVDVCVKVTNGSGDWRRVRKSGGGQRGGAAAVWWHLWLDPHDQFSRDRPRAVLLRRFCTVTTQPIHILLHTRHAHVHGHTFVNTYNRTRDSRVKVCIWTLVAAHVQTDNFYPLPRDRQIVVRICHYPWANCHRALFCSR